MKTAIVTGSNRGIGLGAVKKLAQDGFKVILTSRNEEQGKQALEELGDLKQNVLYHQLDVTDSKSIEALAEFLKNEEISIDVLVNNAGVFLDQMGESALKTNEKVLLETFNINLLGPFRICQAIVPYMRKGGQIINVSSGMGQLSDMQSGAVGYRISKTALNALTKILALELESKDIHVNAICPGWVRTRMGGEHAARDVSKGIESIIWLAHQNEQGPTGKFFRDKEEISW